MQALGLFFIRSAEILVTRYQAQGIIPAMRFDNGHPGASAVTLFDHRVCIFGRVEAALKAYTRTKSP